MATSNSIAAISSRLYRTLFSSYKLTSSCNNISNSFFSTGTDYTSDLDELPLINSDSEQPSSELNNSPESSSPQQRRVSSMSQTILEDGLDLGIYKAIIVGQVAQNPIQKRLKNGRMMTLTTVGTGGIRNERIPFPSEEPKEYANRCNVQWHRVTIYPQQLGEIVMKHAQPGALLYLEGNLETKVFTDPITGLIRRVREIAVRRNGRIVFLGNGSDFSQAPVNELKGVGYY